MNEMVLRWAQAVSNLENSVCVCVCSACPIVIEIKLKTIAH